MTNGEKFKSEFNIYATELWAMPEEDFLKWWKAEVESTKHGQWISIYGWVHCSVCHQEPPNESNIESKYCPNCGARMDKVR